MQVGFRTLRARVLLLVTVTVVFTALAVWVLAQRATIVAMTDAHDEHARNMLDTVLLSVESEYKSILFHESATLEQRKRELRSIVDIALYSIEQCRKQYEDGLVSEEEAKRTALGEIAGMRYDDGVGYLWINDMGRPVPRMLMHPTIPELDGTVLDNPEFNCALGVGKNLFVAFVDTCLEDGAGYVDYLWPKPTEAGLTEDLPKISYVALFKPWNWVVGTGVYVDDIQAEVDKRLEAVLAELRQTLSEVRVAETGYMFIFTHDRQMLAHPSLSGDTPDLRNPVTGNNVLDELMEAAKTPSIPFEYIWDKPGNEDDFRFTKRTYVKHFAPLDWYVASSFYNAEVERPARELGNRILLLCMPILVAAIVFAVWVSGSLTRPLKRLALAALSIEREGMHSADMPVLGTVETQELGTVLNKMITSLRDSERDLRKANNYIGNIINSMPSVLVGVDADGNVTQWNTEAERATGVSAEKAVGQPVAEVFARLAAEMGRVREAMWNRKPLSKPRKVRHEGNEIRYEDLTVYPLVANGVEGAVILLDDVTERVRIEEMMVQSEKMMSIGGLAAGMAHEINNPLAGMIQTAGVMADRLTNPEMPANQRAAEAAGTTMEAILAFMNARGIPRMLENIRTSGGRAAGIVSNMLSFARKGGAAASPQDLAVLLDQCVELARTDYDLKKQYDFRQIEIVREYEEGLPPVPCEPGKIQQVIVNLLRNGAEAMQQGEGDAGPEPDRKPCFHLRLLHEKEAGMVRIEVEDNGPGMDEAARKRVFEPFFTTKPTDRGTGLGLSVSYFIITENHGGKMNVVSHPGEGARFIIRLPVQRAVP